MEKLVVKNKSFWGFDYVKKVNEVLDLLYNQPYLNFNMVDKSGVLFYILGFNNDNYKCDYLILNTKEKKIQKVDKKHFYQNVSGIRIY